MNVSTIAADMPADFPVKEYEQIFARVSPRLGPEMYDQFGGAWNAIAYRFRGMADYAESAGASFDRFRGPPPEERYRQERDLYGFFACAFSVILFFWPTRAS